MKFELNKPIETQLNAVEVDPLPAGNYRFRLVVFNQRGQASLPVEHQVAVQLRIPRGATAVRPDRASPGTSAVARQPAKSKPAKSKPAEAKPVKRPPAKSKPAKSKPVKSKPAKRQRKPRTPPK